MTFQELCKLKIWCLHLTSCWALFTDFNYKNLDTIIYFGQRDNSSTLSSFACNLHVLCNNFSKSHVKVFNQDSEFVCVLTNNHILAAPFLVSRTDSLELITSKSCWRQQCNWVAPENNLFWDLQHIENNLSRFDEK